MIYFSICFFRFNELQLSIFLSLTYHITNLRKNVFSLITNNKRTNALKAFSVDNGWAAFVVFLLGDPHLLEGGKGSQDGSSDPYGVFSLRWSNDFDLDGGWGQGGDFLLHSVGNRKSPPWPHPPSRSKSLHPRRWTSPTASSTDDAQPTPSSPVSSQIQHYTSAHRLALYKHNCAVIAS